MRLNYTNTYFDYTNMHQIIYVFKVHGWSAFDPGASGLSYYCAPLVCVSNVHIKSNMPKRIFTVFDIRYNDIVLI